MRSQDGSEDASTHGVRRSTQACRERGIGKDPSPSEPAATSVRLLPLRWPHALTLHYDVHRSVEDAEESIERWQLWNVEQLIYALIGRHAVSKVRFPLIDYRHGLPFRQLFADFEHTCEVREKKQHIGQ